MAPGTSPKVRTVYAGLNGESLGAKEWGVALRRNAKYFDEALAIFHPAECIGDAGAALGPIMVACAAIGLGRGYRKGPCLVWATSDGPARAAVLLDVVR